MGNQHTGRFAPSPTGPLHAGSLVAALASWLDVRACNQSGTGRWLVRIEDLDTQRCMSGAASTILRQLQSLGLLPDETPVFQSQRTSLYRDALQRLVDTGRVYPCGCSRKEIEAARAGLGLPRQRHAELVYPGTCQNGLHGKAAVAWRFRTIAQGYGPGDQDEPPVQWSDRRLGPQQQQVSSAVGDFVVQRADGPYAYQLAVVVDDAAPQISHVVRGEDLTDNTARQILLQRALGHSQPRYLHTPLVRDAHGEKLSKQNGAQPLDTTQPLQTLNAAAAVLGLQARTGSVADALSAWVAEWRRLYNP